jgi:hypothetical protein
MFRVYRIFLPARFLVNVYAYSGESFKKNIWMYYVLINLFLFRLSTEADADFGVRSY